MFRTLYRQKGELNQRLGFQPTASDIGTLFVRGFPGSFKATADMTPQAVPRLVLKAYVCGHLPALEASLAALPTAVGQRFRQLRESLLAFLRRLPDAAITATPSLPDEISTVTATLAREVEPDEHRRLDKCRGFILPVRHPVMRGKWAIDPAFDRAWEQGMALTVHPAEQETQLWVQKGLRAWHHAWYCVAGTPTPASRDDALAQLSALVKDNTLGLLALTRLLNPAGVAEALGQHILSQFDGGQPDRICYQGLWLQLAKPTVSFEVGPWEGVNIAATLGWQIVGFGPTPRCENTPVAPEGSATLSSTVHIQLRLNQHGVEQHRFSLGPARLLIRETWRCAVPEPLPEMSERSEMVTPLINMMGVFD